MPQGVGLKQKNGESLTSFQVVGSQIPFIPWKISGIFSHAVPKSKFHQKHGSKINESSQVPQQKASQNTIQLKTDIGTYKIPVSSYKSLRFAHLFWSKTSLSYLGEPWNFRASTDSRCFGRPLAAFNFLVVRSLRFTPVKMRPASVSLESLLG